MFTCNETHDPSLKSWVESSNSGSDFPIQNLPFAVFRAREGAESFRGGVAIGDQVLDMAQVAGLEVLSGDAQEAARTAALPELNEFMAMGPTAHSQLRLSLSRMLRAGASEQKALERCLVPQTQADYCVPCRIGDFTDFYSSIHHATTVGKLFRPDKPLLPNYKWIPIGYHGRASTIGVSGQSVRRPLGQTKDQTSAVPGFGPTEKLDYELELGILIGAGSEQGEPIDIAHADEHIFGFCLLNDWSARDIQSWEYQPLGPFLSKSFATTISPWIVTLEALAPYRTTWARPPEDPQPLAYLAQSDNASGAIDITLESLIRTEAMSASGDPAFPLASTSFRHSYWTAAQLVAHHTANGCALQTGDLLGTGTQSGPDEGSSGCLLEQTRGGTMPVTLPNGQKRTFLEDGDTIILRGHCEAPGAVRIGFGEATGTVLPALQERDP